MEYPTKIQGIRRRKGISQCYVNLPLPLAAAIDIQPGEMVEWKVDTRYKLWLIRNFRGQHTQHICDVYRQRLGSKRLCGMRKTNWNKPTSSADGTVTRLLGKVRRWFIQAAVLEQGVQVGLENGSLAIAHLRIVEPKKSIRMPGTNHPRDVNAFPVRGLSLRRSPGSRWAILHGAPAAE